MSLKKQMQNYLEPEWYEVLSDEFDKPYMIQLSETISKERKAGFIIYPKREHVFNAFQYTPFSKVKVVIIGQDPYHGPNQAHGLCFSVLKGVSLPPSLQNIYKELMNDLHIAPPSHGELVSWTQQGVFLLNATLTVRQNNPNSHYGKGWERFTDVVVSKLCMREDPIVFLLWGRSAQEKCTREMMSYSRHHYFLKAPHPSPLSVHKGFFGCKHFSKVNDFLIKQGKTPIDWSIPA